MSYPERQDNSIGATNVPVEKKVWWATGAALLVSMLLAIVLAVQAQPEILFGLPPVLQFLVLAILPPLATFGAGYQAPHTVR